MWYPVSFQLGFQCWILAFAALLHKAAKALGIKLPSHPCRRDLRILQHIQIIQDNWSLLQCWTGKNACRECHYSWLWTQPPYIHIYIQVIRPSHLVKCCLKHLPLQLHPTLRSHQSQSPTLHFEVFVSGVWIWALRGTIVWLHHDCRHAQLLPCTTERLPKGDQIFEMFEALSISFHEKHRIVWKCMEMYGISAGSIASIAETANDVVKRQSSNPTPSPQTTRYPHYPARSQQHCLAPTP